MNQLAIVIPAYKATFLEETLESISNQTDKNFTLYIGDDASPYNLYDIIKKFQDKISIEYKKFSSNLGGNDLVSHWERCIAMTKGEPYIWLFSDDDIMDERCVEVFNSLPAEVKDNSLCHYNIKMIDTLDEGKVKDLPMFPDKMSAGSYLEAKLRGDIVSYVVEFIFSRALYNKVGGFQKFDLAWGSDFMTWLKMAAEAQNGIVTLKSANSWVKWRKSGENISPNTTHPMLIRKIRALVENAVFLKEQMSVYPDKYYPTKKSFRWLRFPLGEMYRKKTLLTKKDKKELCRLYYTKIGYPVYSLLAYLKILW